jgi:hypothetical protein
MVSAAFRLFYHWLPSQILIGDPGIEQVTLDGDTGGLITIIPTPGSMLDAPTEQPIPSTGNIVDDPSAPTFLIDDAQYRPTETQNPQGPVVDVNSTASDADTYTPPGIHPSAVTVPDPSMGLLDLRNGGSPTLDQAAHDADTYTPPGIHPSAVTVPDPSMGLLDLRNGGSPTLDQAVHDADTYTPPGVHPSAVTVRDPSMGLLDLRNGGSADTFVFASGWGTDTVYDFDNGVDKFDMTALHTNFASLTVTSVAGDADVSLGSDLFVVVHGAGLIDAGDFLF